jgi:hypothetical protein
MIIAELRASQAQGARSTMEKVEWIRELVSIEEQLEEAGIVDVDNDPDPEAILAIESTAYLNHIKMEFIDATAAFNDIKTSPLSRVKIYAIAKTAADFMLFRNGFRMIFSLKKPGILSIRFNFMSSTFVPQGQQSGAGAQTLMEEDLIEARWGAFGDISWHYKNEPVRTASMVKYYMSKFIRESLK